MKWLHHNRSTEHDLPERQLLITSDYSVTTTGNDCFCKSTRYTCKCS